MTGLLSLYALSEWQETVVTFASVCCPGRAAVGIAGQAVEQVRDFFAMFCGEFAEKLVDPLKVDGARPFLISLTHVDVIDMYINDNEKR